MVVALRAMSIVGSRPKLAMLVNESGKLLLGTLHTDLQTAINEVQRSDEQLSWSIDRPASNCKEIIAGWVTY